MATPGLLLTNPSQTSDISSWYVNVLSIRQMAFEAANPKLRASGLLLDQPVSEKLYNVPVPPLSLGRVVEFKDGQRPGARKSQGYRLSGECEKRGVEPLLFSEEDRLATRLNWVMQNVKARGRAEALMSDAVGTKAIENGTSAALQPSFDEKAFFATDHLQDVAAGTGSQSNLLALPLTPDNLATAITTIKKWKAENGDPVYAGMALELMLMVPPSLEFIADKAVKRSHVGEGGAAVENVVMGAAEIMVNQFLSSDTAWYLFVKNAGAAPLMRAVFRDMQRRDKGPDSELFRDASQIEIFADEFTDYRLTDWRLGLKSVP